MFYLVTITLSYTKLHHITEYYNPSLFQFFLADKNLHTLCIKWGIVEILNSQVVKLVLRRKESLLEIL